MREIRVAVGRYPSGCTVVLVRLNRKVEKSMHGEDIGITRDSPLEGGLDNLRKQSVGKHVGGDEGEMLFRAAHSQLNPSFCIELGSNRSPTPIHFCTRNAPCGLSFR